MEEEEEKEEEEEEGVLWELGDLKKVYMWLYYDDESVFGRVGAQGVLWVVDKVCCIGERGEGERKGREGRGEEGNYL